MVIFNKKLEIRLDNIFFKPKNVLPQKLSTCPYQIYLLMLTETFSLINSLYHPHYLADMSYLVIVLLLDDRKKTNE